MKLIKALSFVLCVCLILCALSACRNNLVDQWENYTGDTDVYYSTTATTVTTDMAAELEEYEIPEYWADELRVAVADSLKAVNDAEKDYTAFLWYSDAHWSYSANRSVSLLKYLQDYTNIQFVNFGGDIVSDNPEMEYDDILESLEKWREESLKLLNHHSVVGNHDNDIEKYSSRDDLYNFLLSQETGEVPNIKNRFCYYVDNSAENTRYIYLSTGFDETTADDISFLAGSLNSTREDWHIVIVSHIWFVYNDTSTPTVGKVPEFAQVVLDVLDAYNARSSGNTKGVDYDFSSAKARVEFCIGGHTHVDYDFRTDGGIPVILTETDSYHLRGDGKSLSKTDEASVSVIVADYNANIIHIIRAGRGESRTVSISQ